MLSIKPYPRPISKSKIIKKLAKELHVPLRELELQTVTMDDMNGCLVDWAYPNLEELEEDCGE